MHRPNNKHSLEAENSKWLQAKSQAEIDALVAALERNNNNRAQAAKDLGISRVTLYKKLHKYGLF